LIQTLGRQEIDPSAWTYVGAMLPTMLPLLLGGIMFAAPGEIARRAIRIAPEPGGSVGAREVEGIAYAVLGAYLSVEAVVDGVAALAKRHLVERYAAGIGVDEGIGSTAEFVGLLSASLVELGLGLVLVLGAPGIARMRRRVIGLDGR
jgi:hypothetical protein